MYLYFNHVSVIYDVYSSEASLRTARGIKYVYDEQGRYAQMTNDRRKVIGNCVPVSRTEATRV